jgi:hypothetical protein
MATTATTEETPMRIPSTVRSERSLFARRDCSAMLTASPNSMSSPQARRRASSLSIFPSRMWIVRCAWSAMSFS